MFTKYKKSDSRTKILLMYLILNGYDIKKIDHLEIIEEDRQFGLKLKKIYGITNEYVDAKKIEQEIESIKNPLICSPQSFELYANATTIYTYEPMVKEKPLFINDMDIISKVMIITEKCITSENIAAPLEKAQNKGFMFFVDYALKGECKVGNWHITYKNHDFKVFYLSKQKDDTQKEEELYSAIELDKTSTYKLVIYIIRKVVQDMDEFLPDNFKQTKYELEELK